MTTPAIPSSRAEAAALDASDPLARFVPAFRLPEGVIYLNGNSLGPAPEAALARVAAAASEEWAQGLVRSWNTAGWFRSPYRLGDLLAPLIGAGEGEVVVTDNVSHNVFATVSAALEMRPDRRMIVMEGSNFPTDNYVVQGLVRLLGDRNEIRFAEKDALLDAIDDDVATVMLSQVHYRAGHIVDMKAVTAKAHAVGALAIWDLCHSAGAMEVDLNGCDADFAVGCTYKYLNGGPGSTAFLFAAQRHHDVMRQPVSGWWGHAAPFAFERDYTPAKGIGRMLGGTQGILSMVGVEAGLEIAREAGMKAIRAKSRAMGAILQSLMESRLGHAGFVLSVPADPDARGGHIAYDHPDGYAIMQALIARGVIGDFRAPGSMRFGLSPLHLRYVDIWDAIEIFVDVMERETWRDSAHAVRSLVT